jgi:hypothetical protein
MGANQFVEASAQLSYEASTQGLSAFSQAINDEGVMTVLIDYKPEADSDSPASRVSSQLRIQVNARETRISTQGYDMLAAMAERIADGQ